MKSQVEEKLSDEELQQIQNGTHIKMTQKIRICGDNENLLRMVILAILLVIIVAAALATVHLHRIADYEVCFTSMRQYSVIDIDCFRTSSILPKHWPLGSKPVNYEWFIDL